MMDFFSRYWLRTKHNLQKKWVRQALYALTVLASLLFIGIAILSNWTELQNQKWQVQAGYAILAVVLHPIGMLPAAAVWHWLLRAFGAQTGFRINLRYYALSNLPKHIPGLVWFVSSRTLLYQEHGERAAVVLAATATETVLLALSGFSISLLYFAARIEALDQFPALRLVIPISIALIVLILVWTAGGSNWLEKLYRRWRKDDEAFRFDRPALWISLGWMFLAWCGGGCLLWLTVKALTPVSYQVLPAVVGIWAMAGAVSFTIGMLVNGMGLREVTLAAMLSTIISPLVAIAVAVVFRLILLVGELLWVSLIALITKN
jgi:hypothetical protein